MQVVFAGGRDFTNPYLALEIVINAYKRDFLPASKDLVCISGEAKGADKTFAKVLANSGVQVLKYPAKWNDITATTDNPVKLAVNTRGSYNKLAGYNRNRLMSDIGEKLVAVWNGSNGTYHMIETMINKEKPVLVYDYDGKLIYSYYVECSPSLALLKLKDVRQAL